VLVLISKDIYGRRIGNKRWMRSSKTAGFISKSSINPKLINELEQMFLFALMKSILLWYIRDMHACKLIINLHLPILIKSKSIIENKSPITLGKNP